MGGKRQPVIGSFVASKPPILALILDLKLSGAPFTVKNINSDRTAAIKCILKKCITHVLAADWSVWCFVRAKMQKTGRDAWETGR